MMRLYCVIATAMLMPLTAQATVYDVAKPSELNQICSTHSSFDIQRTDTTFFCHGKIVLPAGDSIISSSPENEVILEAHQGIVLEGNNRIGEVQHHYW